MEKNYFINLPIRDPKNWSLLFIILLGWNVQVDAQVRDPFTQRASEASPNRKVYNINGDFTMIGNTNMTLWEYSVDKMNSNNYMTVVDEDGDANTANSSSATLTFSTENDASSECSNVLFAGLYWTGRTDNTVSNVDKRKIKFKGPNGSYQNISASSYQTPGDNNMYTAFTEVTDIVKTGGTGEYWVADMALTTGNGGSTGYYGGWGMIVVYENQQMNLRDVTVFDGYAYVEGNVNRSYELPVSGFNTAQDGPVNMKLGMMAGEGDRGISGDYFQIQKLNTEFWQTLSHDQNGTNNFFNSSIKTEGTRSPDLVNNTGLDISMFNIQNNSNSVIGNKQSSTKFRYGSTQDTYIIFSMAMSVDAYIPNFEVETSTKDRSAKPGEEIKYKLEVYNRGTEDINNAKVTIPVPLNLEFVSGEAQWKDETPSPNEITYDPALGPNGSVIWNIGTLSLPDNTNKSLGDLELKFKVTEDCTILKYSSCGDQFQIPFTGSLSGTGAITNASFSDKGLIQGYQKKGECKGQPITEALLVEIDASKYIHDNCQSTPDELSFQTCDSQNGILVNDIKGNFPSGIKFYDNYPINGANQITGNFPTTPGTTTYYAILKGSNTCYIPFTIVIDKITTVPKTNDVEYCIGEEAVPLVATPTNQDYQLFYYTSEDGNPQTSITPSTSTAGKFTYYVAEGESSNCISPNKSIITVQVYSKPEASAPRNIEIEGCGTNFSNAGIPAFSSDFQSISQTVFEDLGGTISSEKEIINVKYRDHLDQAFPTLITRTFRITSDCGNVNVQQVIKVIDTTSPEAISLEDAIGQCAVNVKAPVTSDNCDGEITATTNDAVSYSDQGIHSITWTFTDKSGNKTTAIQKIIVKDNIAPEITCQNDISETVDSGVTTAIITYNAPGASDNCEFTVEQTAGLASGSAFPLGTTTNTFVVTDAAGNTATCSFDVTITDTEAPTISCPANIDVNVDAGICGAVVEFDTPEGFDNSGDVTVTQITGPASGETFPVGTTTVTFKVTDTAGNSVDCSFDVTVNDNEDPEITSVPNITQNVDMDSCSATVEYQVPTANDNCEGVTVELTKGLASGEAFPLGETTVTYTATDAAGNKVTTTFTVNVIDNIAPEITCQNDISETVDSGVTTAVVTYNAPAASDNCELHCGTNRRTCFRKCIPTGNHHQHFCGDRCCRKHCYL